MADTLTKRGLAGLQSAIVNHGDYRNHAHLHVKCKFAWPEFNRALRQWSPEEQGQWARLQAFNASPSAR